MTSSIHRLPLCVLEDVVLGLHDDPLSPLSVVLPLLFTSKHFYTRLGFKANDHLYARIFRLCFDTSAFVRRLGYINARGLSVQLRANYDALKCIRRGDIHANNILRSFWTAFSMLMENDGKNRCHLDAAGLHKFLDTFIRKRLYENSIDGWPGDDEVNSLALWLLWLTMSQEGLETQAPTQRADMTRLILPYVLMPVRYPAYFAPHVHYPIPLPQNPAVIPHPFDTPHGEYPHYLENVSRTIRLYHSYIELSIPLASIAAKLIYHSRRKVNPIEVLVSLPRNRAHALELGINTISPTQEDVEELNEHNSINLVPESTWEWWSEIKDYDRLGRGARSRLAPSTQWDSDWNRLAECINIFRSVPFRRTYYTPGSLCGLWQGWMVCPDEDLHGDLIRVPQMPPMFDIMSIDPVFMPVFMRLREYHCMDVEPNQPAPSGSIEYSWFHSSPPFQEPVTSHYNEYVIGSPDPHDESKCRGCKNRGTPDIVFRESDEQYLSMLDNVLEDEGMEDVGDEQDGFKGKDMNNVGTNTVMNEKFVIKRKCDGILDIVLVGETDSRHGEAWHHYKFFGRVRRWDGLVALLRVPAHTSEAARKILIFTGYVIGGKNFVGNWRTTERPGRPVTSEGTLVMSKRE